jgi:alpha-D-ribose 1-methylphosphonate 5-triphosphate synthase subunit PhnI
MKPRGKHPLVEERRNNEENVKINLNEIGFEVPIPMNLP